MSDSMVPSIIHKAAPSFLEKPEEWVRLCKIEIISSWITLPFDFLVSFVLHEHAGDGVQTGIFFSGIPENIHKAIHSITKDFDPLCLVIATSISEKELFFQVETASGVKLQKFTRETESDWAALPEYFPTKPFLQEIIYQ